MAANDAHLTWSGGSPCLWVWDATRTAPATVLFAAYARLFARTPVGRVDRLELDLPGQGARPAQCLRISVAHLVELFADRPASPSWSASLRWFHQAVELATQIAVSGRVTPVIAEDSVGVDARWVPVVDDVVTAAVAALGAERPPVCDAAGPFDLDHVIAELVDAVARQALRWQRWSAPLPNSRKRPVATVRGAFQALTDPGRPRLRTAYGPDGTLEDIRLVARVLDDERRRAAGEPVVRGRLRLHVPADIEEPWRIGLEVADATDAGRWCTAGDVWAVSPLAVDVAGDERHVPVLAQELVRAAVRLSASVPPLRRLLDTAEPDLLELDIDEVGALLEAASRVEAANVELLGPEQLLRSSARVKGQATPAPAAVRSGGLDAKALVEWTLTIDGEVVNVADVVRAEAAGASLMHIGGRWVRLEGAQVRKALETLTHHQRELSSVDALTLMKLAAESDPAAGGVGVADVAGAGVVELDGRGWVGDLLAGLPDEQLVEAHEPEGFVGELRHYQRRGLAWLGFLARLGLGGCLADDMGLGKTATALAHLLGRPGPHLVVCPLSVVRNWEREAARFAPALRVAIHHGDERARGAEAAGELASADLVLTTYGLLAREIDVLGAVDWTTVVLDEAQAVKNPHTKAARAARKLRAGQMLALTGTPVENRLSELWAILDVVDPGLLGSLPRFQQRFAVPIERDRDEAAAEQLRRLTRPFVLRRTKADKTLVPDLPDKIEQIAWATLTREQATLYQSVVDQLLADAEQEQGMRRRGLVLASLTRLKQICNHPAQALGDGSRLGGRSGKLARFDELVDELLDAGEQALVFTQYRQMGELLQRHLHERLDRRVPFLHGGVARKQRDAMVDRFQASIGGSGSGGVAIGPAGGGAEPLLLVSLKAGGTGLNLTAASRVIHYDRWWNPAVEDQATDRAWRIGQHHTVFVHKLVCSGTLEERIGQLIDDKRAIAASVIGEPSSEAWLSELSTDQLRELVMLDAAEATVPGSRS